MKDTLIDVKVKKKNEEEQKRRNHIRNVISSKFDRSRSIREELVQGERSRAKATLERIDRGLKAFD